MLTKIGPNESNKIVLVCGGVEECFILLRDIVAS